jgi:hypothetical protein
MANEAISLEEAARLMAENFRELQQRSGMTDEQMVRIVNEWGARIGGFPNNAAAAAVIDAQPMRQITPTEIAMICNAHGFMKDMTEVPRDTDYVAARFNGRWFQVGGAKS